MKTAQIHDLLSNPYTIGVRESWIFLNDGAGNLLECGNFEDIEKTRLFLQTAIGRLKLSVPSHSGFLKRHTVIVRKGYDDNIKEKELDRPLSDLISPHYHPKSPVNVLINFGLVLADESVQQQTMRQYIRAILEKQGVGCDVSILGSGMYSLSSLGYKDYYDEINEIVNKLTQ